MYKDEDLIYFDSDLIHDTVELNETLNSLSGKVICIARKEIFETVDIKDVIEGLENSDVIHCGLLFEGAIAFTDLQVVTINWNFLVPDNTQAAFTWKATSDFICFRSGLFVKMNGFVPGLSLNAALMEFCYRAMMSGANVSYNPELVKKGSSYNVSISKQDNLYFARHHLGSKHFRFLQFYYFFSNLSWSKIVVGSSPPTINENSTYQFKVNGTEKVRSVGPYTAIIPTIDRYAYIERSIQSLLQHPFPPNEIIVVDQTPAPDRHPEIYEPYSREVNLRVFYLDTPGQCTSRNLAIEKATNEWLLFFEDDTEAWPDMMKEHIGLMEHSWADVSTGVSLAPWKDVSYIPSTIRKYHIADVLATGNCFMMKKTALSVGGLHPAFNRGSGADDDFGKRLFLAGKLIVFNHKAIQTHHKAPRGGMRVHGAWWRNTSKLLDAYPPPTQLYMLRKYYPPKKWLAQIILFYLLARKKMNYFRFGLSIILAPLKYYRSLRIVKKLETRI